MAIKGSGAKVQISTDDSTYTDVGGLNSVDIDPSYDSADVSQFGDTGNRKLPTLGHFSGSGTGFRDTTDAGQTAVVTASNNRTLLWFKVLPNGTTGWKAQCAVKIKVGAKQGNEAVSFGFDFEEAGGAAPTPV